MKVIFLDIDGVFNIHEPLHPSVMCGQIHADKVDRFNKVLINTGAHIVLSSAWRYLVHRGEMNLIGLEWLLRSHGLFKGALIGVTRPDTMVDGKPVENERGQQISDWLREHPNVTRYVVVDDLDLGISAAGHAFVHVDAMTGLSDVDAIKIVKHLKW